MYLEGKKNKIETTRKCHELYYIVIDVIIIVL